MKVVILENEPKWQKEIKEIVVKIAFDKYDVKILQFNRGSKELMEEIKDMSEPKIYILDIELEGKISGITIAKKIREIDWESHIIFLTSHDGMFTDVYKEIYEVFDFIEKFYDMEARLTKDINLILSRENNNHMFEYHTRNIDFKIYCRDILYIERDTNERKLVIHTASNTFTIKMNMSDIIKVLDGRFRQVHRSCIINKDHVVKYDWNAGLFELKDGTEIPLLSKKYREDEQYEAECI